MLLIQSLETFTKGIHWLLRLTRCHGSRFGIGLKLRSNRTRILKARGWTRIIPRVTGITARVLSVTLNAKQGRINVANDRFSIVTTGAGDGSFSFNVADSMETNSVYYLQFILTADGIQQSYEDIAITKKPDGSICFVKSMCYDFNVERCSELWTDAQSLDECLQPQNDVNCDSPIVITTAQRLTQHCTDDWSKVYAIYDYMVNEFAYDYVQINAIAKDGQIHNDA